MEDRVDCAISGGGPAGMMLGLLLARHGLHVTVFEKHADFFRDFRGDTVHPSTLSIIDELGLLEEFLKRPHQKASRITAYFGDHPVVMADFSRVKLKCPYIAFTPQWEFLNFIASAAKPYPNFRLQMEHDVKGLRREGDRVVGLLGETPTGKFEIRADLVVSADGRHSTLRREAGLESREFGASMDVLWMRLPKRAGDPKEPLGRFSSGKIFIFIERDDYWQCGLVIPKGAFDRIKTAGLDAFRATLANAAPFVRDRTDALQSWNDIKLLTVRIDRLKKWWTPGFLAIGDAAHAMSPVGGVGINLAVQDAVAAANILAVPLKEKKLSDADLKKVQKRREFPTRVTQRAQLLVQDRFIQRVLTSKEETPVPTAARLLERFPWLRQFPARLIGIGIRPEHIKVPTSF